MSAISVDSSDWDATVLRSAEITVVDFWAPWCSWCRKLAPEYDALASEYDGKVRFAKLNADNSSEIARRYGVQGFPRLKVFYRGRVIAELIGYRPKATLRHEIDHIVSVLTLRADPPRT